MNLCHFEDEVSPAIVERGIEYYEAGFVTNLVNSGDGRYTAVVRGADMYEIAVQLDKDRNIISSYCDCPYDMGQVCKHEVAIYYALIERLQDNDFIEIDIAITQPDLKATLESLPKEKLTDILIELAKNNQTLYNELLFTYAIVDERHEIDRCKKMIHSIIDKYSSGERLFASDFANELKVVLNKIDRLRDPLIAIEIAGLLLMEAVKAIQYTDDSGGDIGSLLDETIQMMHMIANVPLEIVEQSEMLDYLIQLSKDNVFEGWEDFRIDVLGVCMRLTETEQLRNTLMNELQSMIVDSSANHYNRYSNERVLNLVYDIIETHDSTEAAMQFLQENVNYPSFRKQLMQYEMKQGNFESVISLAAEGERMDKDYRGLVSRWKKWRYRAYEQLNMPKEQAVIGRELLTEGHFDFYTVLKELTADDHPSFYDNLKQELAVQNHSMYVHLIETENDVEAILDYVRENPLLIEQYLKYLMDTHKEEAIRLFEFHVKTIAEAAYNRKQYKEVCQVLKRFRNTAGREAQICIVEEFKMKYKNHPAFMEELDKL